MSQRRESALQQYILQGVKETGVELGRGSYAAVHTVECKGLTCAAKIFHQTLYRQEYSIRRFQEECAILSQLRHPNIVQFLGVYYQPGSILPALVMECLPMTLAQSLDQYGVLPNEISYSILKDVALALSYLHQHNPAIIHRDLSANNVLLTREMTAKISDLGVAKMLDLSPTLMRTMTNGPGTPCYMPPEALEGNTRYAHYNCKVDAFSYGVLMVHLFSGQWPFPSKPVKVDPQDDSRIIPQSEADRRQENLDIIGRDHPLLTLILRCLHNSPARRPEAVEILTLVNQVAAQFPSSSKVELLQQVTSLRADTATLQQANTSLRANVETLQQANRSLRADTKTLQQANTLLLTNIGTQQQANRSLRADTERLKRGHEAEITSMRADTEMLQQANASLRTNIETLQQANRSLRAGTERLKQGHEVEIRSLRADTERLQQEQQTEIRSLREISLAELVSTRQTLQAKVKSAQIKQREAEKAVEESQRKLEDAQRCHSVEVELRLADIRDTLSLRLREVETELKAARQQISFKNSALTNREDEVAKLTGQMVGLRQEMVENEKAFDQHLVQLEKGFKQLLFTKDQQLVEKQKEFDQELIHVKKGFEQELVKKQKEFEQHLLANVVEIQKEIDQNKDEFKQKLLIKNKLLIEKEHTLVEKDQQLQMLREKEAEFGALLQSKEAILSSKQSLVASKDSVIHGLQEQLNHLRKSQGITSLTGVLNKQVKHLHGGQQMERKSMESLLDGLYDSLEAIGVSGPLMENGGLENAVRDGISSPQFIELCTHLCAELKALNNMQEVVSTPSGPSDKESFEMEMRSFLIELGCPHASLSERGCVLEGFENRLMLVDFLLSELMSSRLLARKKKEDDSESRGGGPPLSDIAGNLTAILKVYGIASPPPNVTVQQLFQKIINKVPDRGGRPQETCPPPEMPSFKQRTEPQRGGWGGGVVSFLDPMHIRVTSRTYGSGNETRGGGGGGRVQGGWAGGGRGGGMGGKWQQREWKQS